MLKCRRSQVTIFLAVVSPRLLSITVSPIVCLKTMAGLSSMSLRLHESVSFRSKITLHISEANVSSLARTDGVCRSSFRPSYISYVSKDFIH